MSTATAPASTAQWGLQGAPIHPDTWQGGPVASFPVYDTEDEVRAAADSINRRHPDLPPVQVLTRDHPGQPWRLAPNLRLPGPTLPTPPMDDEPADPDNLPPYDVDACETCGGVGEVVAEPNGWNPRPTSYTCRTCDGTGDRPAPGRGWVA